MKFPEPFSSLYRVVGKDIQKNARTISLLHPKDPTLGHRDLIEDNTEPKRDSEDRLRMK